MAVASAPVTGALINATYPVDYVALAGVDQLVSPDSLWWASKQRYSSINPSQQKEYLSQAQGGIQTSEFLQLDLGRVRALNYINLSVLKAPIGIEIEYDAMSATDGTHSWRRVTHLTNAQFDHEIHYEAQHKNPWHLAEFYFTDSKGNMLSTQYLRIRFNRRDVDWPVKNATPFRWPILVKELRVARYIRNVYDTIGILFESPFSTAFLAPEPLGATATQDLRQQFSMPPDAARGTIDPHIMGFGVLVKTPTTTVDEATGIHPLDQFKMQWSLWDITNPTQHEKLYSGVETGAFTAGSSWVDVYFDAFEPLDTDHTQPKIYELRVSSLNTVVSNAFGVQPVNYVPGISLSGGGVPNAAGTAYYTVPDGTQYTFVAGSTSVTTTVDVTQYLTVGEQISKQNRVDGVWQIQSLAWNGSVGTITLTAPFVGTSEDTNAIKALPLTYAGSTNTITDYQNALTMRLWGDVVDSGRDFLGNSYRYITNYDEGDEVGTSAEVGWQSAPQPSPDAVEALYFDIRTLKDGVPKPGVVDAIRIAPRTPGVVMHIYSTQANLSSMQGGKLRSPQTRDEWDQMLWTPIHQTYTLQKDHIFTLPKQIRAGFIKLEFTRLQPLPFRVPSRPSLPEISFRRYPTWIESQFTNALVRRVVQDWFVRNKTLVETNILKRLTDPILEFQYKEREFLAALALGKIKANTSNAAIINTTQKALIDPVTGSKILFRTTDMYKGTLVANVNKDSVLGQVVLSRFDPLNPTDPVEGTPNPNSRVPISSTPNNRIQESFAYLAQTPMWFNQIARHHYKIDHAQFKSQAYFVGIDEVAFLRKDYTVFRDDTVIQDSLTDTDQLELNSFIPDTPSKIAQALFGNKPQSGVLQNTVTVYISYSVNDQQFTDEKVTFVDLTSLILLTGSGGVAENVIVSSSPGGTGVQYQYGVDFDLVYTTDDILGTTRNSIRVSDLSRRWVVALGNTNQDSNTVLGRAFISGVDKYNPGVQVIEEVNTVAGHASISSLQGYGVILASTASGKGNLTAVEEYASVHQFIDAATVSGHLDTTINAPADAELTLFADTPVAVSELTGVGLHQGAPLTNALDTTLPYLSYPDLNLFTIWIGWSTLQPASRNDFVWPAAIDASINDAQLGGYKVVLKIACGADTPSWVYTDATNPVQSITTIATDLVTGQITMPVPWNANLLILYKNLLTKLKPKIDPLQSTGLTSSGVRRSDMIYFIPSSMGMETSLGCGMALPYGAAAVYTGSATLAANITGTTPSFTATGANSGAYPTGSFLMKIDSELLYVSRSGGSDTITVNSGGRGWSGSTATSHLTGATVQYASSVPWTGTFNSHTGPFDVNQQNKTQWLTVGTEVTNTSNLLAAWKNAIDANITLVSAFSNIPTAISYGPNFSDNWANAASVAELKVPENPVDLWSMTDDLQPGNDGANGPSKNGQATYYEGYSLPAGGVIRQVIALNGLVGFQAAPASVFNVFTDPFSGASSAFREVIDDSLSVFTPTFLLVSKTELDSGP